MRHEFVALMEAAALGADAQMEAGGDASAVRDLQMQLASTEADLKLQKSVAASAQDHAQQQSKRADVSALHTPDYLSASFPHSLLAQSLAARLDAAEAALKKMGSEVESLRSDTEARQTSVSPRLLPPVPAPPPPKPPSVSPSNNSPQADSSSWIAR